jgi:hypothetical protein
MTCPICTHPERPAIDVALHARQAARAKGQAPADGLGALARQHGVAKSHLSHHRDTCDLGAPDATQAGVGGPAQTREEQTPVQVRSSARNSGTAIAVAKKIPDQIDGGISRPPAAPLDANAPPHVLATKTGTRATATAPQVDRIYEIARVLTQADWRGHDSVVEYAQKWNVHPNTIYENYRQACALLKLARGELVQELEVSALRWKDLYEEAMKSESKTKIRDAAEALKGYDRVVGLIDQGAKVQVNIAQSPQAQDFMRAVFDALRPYPEALSAVRERLLAERAKVGDVGSMVSVVTVEDQG